MAQSPDEVARESRGVDNANISRASLTSDQVRSQIEQTRSEMSDTIDAIQTRLSPTRLATQAKDSVKNATVGRVRRFAHSSKTAGGSFLEAVRNNPWPAAAAVVVAAIIVVGLRRRRRPTTAHYGETASPQRFESW